VEVDEFEGGGEVELLGHGDVVVPLPAVCVTVNELEADGTVLLPVREGGAVELRREVVTVELTLDDGSDPVPPVEDETVTVPLVRGGTVLDGSPEDGEVIVLLLDGTVVEEIDSLEELGPVPLGRVEVLFVKGGVAVPEELLDVVGGGTV
jgi:hypothetical protein